MRFRLSTDQTYDTTDYWVADATVSSLAAFNWADALATGTVPSGTPAGQYYLVWSIDALGEVSEFLESNNTGATSTRVTVQQAVLDLTAPGVSWAMDTLSEGTATWVEFQVKNEGTGSATVTYANAWLSTDNDFDTSDDYYLGEMQVAALASGASDYPQWDFNMPDIGAGSYSVWMLCEVDSRSQIPESNESNLYKSNGYFTATDSVSTGEIRGSKWNDLDGDGTWDGGEPGLANWRIYVDQDQDGQWDSGEPSQLTDSSGNYAFTGLASGTYVIGEVQQSGWQQTWPSSAASQPTGSASGGTNPTYDPSNRKTTTENAYCTCRSWFSRQPPREIITTVRRPRQLPDRYFGEHCFC